MPRRAKAKGLYQRGPYWLDYDKRADGSLRSPNLAIFWYDAAGGRIRSASARTSDVTAARTALDRHYLEHSQGEAICPTCGQRRQAGTGLLVMRAITDYLASNEDSPSIGAIRPRLSHVIRYIAERGQTGLKCEQVDERWVRGFREWLQPQPVLVETREGVREKPRAPSRVENSVIQLAAAINAANRRGDTLRPAQFKPVQTKELNNTPKRRLTLDELASAFRYALDPKFPTKRKNLLRFLRISVATACRPDAAHDFSTLPARGQWHPASRVMALNPKGRRQTKKYRATSIAPWQLVADLEQTEGYYVTGSVRSAYDSMCEFLGWPKDGENGMKLIRRSIAQLLRDPARKVPSEQIELQLGHRRIDSVSDLYAAFDPAYLCDATRAIEGIIDEIESRVPGAFHRSVTGEQPKIVAIGSARRHLNA